MFSSYNHDMCTGCANSVVRPHAVYQATGGTPTLRYCDGNGDLTNRTISAGSCMPTTKHVHYVRGMGQTVAIIKRVSGTPRTRNLHCDHLSSV